MKMNTDLKTLSKETPPSEGKPYNASWFVWAPWAHPHWSQYAIFLFDLTTKTSEEPFLLFEGAQYEVQVWAVYPDHELRPPLPENPTARVLGPMNHGYQFKAESDKAAFDRVQSVVELIEKSKLSPDTDFIHAWDEIFKDGMSLRNSIYGNQEDVRE